MKPVVGSTVRDLKTQPPLIGTVLKISDDGKWCRVEWEIPDGNGFELRSTSELEVLE